MLIKSRSMNQDIKKQKQYDLTAQEMVPGPSFTTEAMWM